jgi:hypothetical protein
LFLIRFKTYPNGKNIDFYDLGKFGTQKYPKNGPKMAQKWPILGGSNFGPPGKVFNPKKN